MKNKEYGYVSKEFVGDFPWITDCDFSFIKSMSMVQKVTYAKEEIIIHQGESNQNVFYIENGRVKYSIYGIDGREKTIAILIEGNIFGEISSWDGYPSPCSVVAVTNEVVAYRINDIRTLCTKPEHTFEFIKSIIRKNRMLISGSVAYNMKSASSRIATCLLSLSKKFGVSNREGDTEILVHFTHQQLADLMGVSRVTATNILNNMRKEQIISWETRYLIIKDAKKLKDMASIY